MSVRSHYSATSYKNLRPGTWQHIRREKGEEMPSIVEAKAECGTCIYKRMAEQYMKELEMREKGIPLPYPEPVMIGNQMGVRKTSELGSVVTYQAPVQAEPEKPKEAPKGLFERFGAYVAKNQKDMRDRGETNLFDDLAKYGKGLSDGTASLGMEEIAGYEKKRAASKKFDPEADDRLLDELSGKKRKK